MYLKKLLLQEVLYRFQKEKQTFQAIERFVFYINRAVIYHRD